MSSGGEIALIVFGGLILLGLAGGIVALVLIERNRKKKKQENGGGNGDGDGGGTSQNDISIQNVDNTDLHFRVFYNNADDKANFNMDKIKDSATCKSYSFEHGTYTQGNSIKLENAIISTDVGLSQLAFSNPCNTDSDCLDGVKCVNKPVVPGGPSSKICDVKQSLYVLGVTKAEAGQSLGVFNPQNSSTNEFQWIYDSRSDKKTWCLQTDPSLCLTQDPQGSGVPIGVKIEKLVTDSSGKVASKFQWNNIPPPQVGKDPCKAV